MFNLTNHLCNVVYVDKIKAVSQTISCFKDQMLGSKNIQKLQAILAQT